MISSSTNSTPIIADRLREARIAAGLSQADLADLVGMAQSGIAAIETGKSERPTKIVELARAVDRSPEWLLGLRESGAGAVFVEARPLPATAAALAFVAEMFARHRISSVERDVLVSGLIAAEAAA